MVGYELLNGCVHQSDHPPSFILLENLSNRMTSRFTFLYDLLCIRTFYFQGNMSFGLTKVVNKRR